MEEQNYTSTQVKEVLTLLRSMSKELYSNHWYTTKEAADYLRISERSIRRAMETGRLKYARIGDGKRGSIRFTRKWLDAYTLGFNGHRLSDSQKALLVDLY
jgi:excisionase family DNA binding protein